MERLETDGRVAICPLSDWLSQPDVRVDPHRVYATLREHAPVVRVELTGGVQVWLVTRYNEAMEVLFDRRFAKDAAHWHAWQRGEVELTNETMLAAGFSMATVDGPQHTRLRGALDRTFTQGRVERLRGWIANCSEDLIDRFAGRGAAELVGEYAAPLSMAVICELFGAEPADRPWVHEQAKALTARPPQELGAVMAGIHGYLGGLVVARRERPGNDLTSALLRMPPEDRLTDGELVDMLSLLLVFGHDITTNLVGNALSLILRHPGQQRILRREPWRVDDAVEEVVRYDGPIANVMWRFAVEDTAVGGVSIRAGEPVIVSVAAANRDPRHFQAADTFDITNPARWHLAFGHGAHRCMAAPLARATAQVALQQIVQRLDDLQLAVAPEDMSYRAGASFRGLVALPVAFRPYA